MHVTALLVVLGLTLSGSALAQTGAQRTSRTAPTFDRGPYEIPHTTVTLDNGLTLIVHEDHTVPVVAVNLWYHVGSRNEVRGRTWFAHLFEHFFFNGSEHHPGGFREAMDDLGATNRNGTTSTDRTNFFENVPTSALERTLYLEADRMGFLAGHISDAMLTRERGVVQNEKRQGENQPYGRVFSRMVQTLYPYSHPYSWPTIGYMEDLDAARLDDVKEWYRTYYAPNNCVLSLAGDITVDRAVALVRKYFGGIPPGPPLARSTAWVPAFDAPVRDAMQDRVPQARIYRVYHAPAWREPELQRLNVLTAVLSGSKSARLDRRLIYEKAVATAVSAELWEKELASNVIITVTLKPDVDLAVAERELDTVLAELFERGPTAAEVTRAQTQLLAEFVRGTERLGGFGGRSDVLAESFTFGDRADAYLTRLDALATATPEQVRAAGRRWLTPAHYTLVVTPYAPKPSGETSLDRTVLPSLGEAPTVRFPAVQRATLTNGLRVLLLERPTSPLVNLSLAVDAGSSADPADQAGIAAFTLALLTQGTTTRDAFQIDEALTSGGARISTRNALDLSFVRLEALPQQLAPALTIFADVVVNPTFPESMVQLEQRLRLARIAQEKAQPVSAALRLLPPLLYGATHPYGKPFSGSGYESTIAQLGRADLATWHRTWFQPGNSTLVVTGRARLAELIPMLERVFAGWKPGEAPRKTLDRVAPATRALYVVDKPDAPQSVIVAAHLSEPGGHVDDLAIETVMRAFGGIATSRLNRNLRLDKHWSYGVSASLTDARGPRPLFVVAPVQADKTVESMREILQEYRDISGARPIAGEEFASTMRNQLMGLPGRFETLDALEAAAVDLVNLGYADDYFAEYANRVRSLDESALASAGRRFIRPESLTWVVIGDLKQIESGLRGLGFGEVVRLDADGRPASARAE
ncbi:MAG: M16 family metallopeptidase [Vicinamibacterales bacterium]